MVLPSQCKVDFSDLPTQVKCFKQFFPSSIMGGFYQKIVERIEKIVQKCIAAGCMFDVAPLESLFFVIGA